MRKLAFPAILIFTFALTACWSSKQQLYTTVSNQSGTNLRAIEVNYPGGTYGIPELKQGESNRKFVFVNPPCTYTVNFEDTKGKQYHSKPLDFGKDKCPSEISLTIDSTMNVSAGAK